MNAMLASILAIVVFCWIGALATLFRLNLLRAFEEHGGRFVWEWIDRKARARFLLFVTWSVIAVASGIVGAALIEQAR